MLCNLEDQWNFSDNKGLQIGLLVGIVALILIGVVIALIQKVLEKKRGETPRESQTPDSAEEIEAESAEAQSEQDEQDPEDILEGVLRELPPDEPPETKDDYKS